MASAAAGLGAEPRDAARLRLDRGGEKWAKKTLRKLSLEEKVGQLFMVWVLGFRGLVVTDALDMAALTELYAADVGRAAVDAFTAGNDLLIIPPDLAASYTAILAATRGGEIPTGRIDEAVLKVLRWKAALRLHKERRADVTKVATRVGRLESAQAGQEAADAAVTLVRDSGKVLPIVRSEAAMAVLPYRPAPEVRNRVVAILFSPDLRGESSRVFEAELRARVSDARVIAVDPRTGTSGSERLSRRSTRRAP